MAQWSLNFDGVNDKVEMGDVPTDALHAMTIELWVLISSADSAPIMTKWTGTESTSAWSIGLDGNGDLECNVVVDVSGEGPQSMQCTASIEHGVWTHVALVWDDPDLTLYIDGQSKDSASSSGAAVTNTCATAAVLAYNTDFGNDYFAGKIAYARITDDAAYTGSTFDLPRLPAFPDVHTLCQWDMIEGTGASINNREGTTTFDGVITGGAMWSSNIPTGFWGSGYEQWGDEWTVFIDDVDRTAVIALESIEIVQLLGSNRDTAVFRIEDVTSSVAVQSWQHVQIWHGGYLEFGGFLMATDKLVNGITMDIVCHCVDWTVLLDKRVIAARETWTSATALTILKDITEAEYVPEVNATLFTGTGATGLNVENDYGYVSDLVAKLADASDYYWFVREDEEGDVYLYFSDAETAAPFGLSTSPDLDTTMPLRVLQWSASGSDIVNDFYLVVEGAEGSSTFTTGGTLGNVRTLDDRNVVQITNSTSAATYGLLSATIKMGQEEKTLYNTAFLTSLGDERITGRIEIRYSGVRPGMTIGIEHSVLDVDDSYLVHQVRTRPLGGSSIRCELVVSNDRKLPSTAVDVWRTVWNRLELASARPRADLVKRDT